ncbi:DNA repair protein RadA, partial [Candidatus Parcubacteria bacterium]
MFHCTYCDSQYAKWQGRCLECGRWGTIVAEEDTGLTDKKNNKHQTAKPAEIIKLTKNKVKPANRQASKISELDRVLGGGIVPGSVILLAGEPGIGKSTLVAQIAANFKSPYYVSGEESERQVALRLQRLKIASENILFSNTTEINSIISAAQKQNPSLLIIDSIQTTEVSDLDSLPGAPNTVRAATAKLINYAKENNVPVLLIGQVTKEGSVAGPKTLEHLVDTVLYIEGDKQSPYRLLRAAKNRFGSTDEVGIFEMTNTGLQTVENPSERFLEKNKQTSGTVITSIMEGSRPIMVEV